MAAFATYQSIHAAASHRPCKIASSDRERTIVHTAECYYDDSGTLIYWIFSIVSPRQQPVDPDAAATSPTPIERRVAITGFPKVWQAQKDYRGGDHPIWKPASGFAHQSREIERLWRARQSQIEAIWQGQEAKRRSERIFNHIRLPIPTLLPNLTSPFLPVFHLPSNIVGDPPRDQSMTAFCANNPNASSCQDYTTADMIARGACGNNPGCDFADPLVRQWKYQQCLAAGVGNCQVHLKWVPTLDDVIGSHFQPWILRGTQERSDFPPARVDYYPGTLNVETVRLPLYEAARSLVWSWNQSWGECWAATSVGTRFDGCSADLRDYLSGAALEKASAKTYPNARVAAGMRTVANVADGANRFHVATRDLVRFTNSDKWGNGVEFNHLEPDDIPPDVSRNIQSAERLLNGAVREMRSFLWR